MNAMMGDTFHDSKTAAFEEAKRRRSDPAAKDFIIRVEPSPYGGYKVRAYPVDLYVDGLADVGFPGLHRASRYAVGG